MPMYEVAQEMVERWLKLLFMLSPSTPTTSALLAEELGVSRQTIKRDMQRMVEAGFAIDANEKGYLIAKPAHEAIARLGE